MPVAISQPTVATRLLVTFAMPRPMPPATAHTTKLGHEKRTLSGSKTDWGDCFRVARYAALMSLSATIAPSRPVTVDSSHQTLSRLKISRTHRLLTPGQYQQGRDDFPGVPWVALVILAGEGSCGGRNAAPSLAGSGQPVDSECPLGGRGAMRTP